MSPPARPRRTAPSRVFALDPTHLLVFKPRGHVEPRHQHAYGQTLTVLSGRLAVEFARSRRVLGDRAPPLRIAAGRPHATRALSSVWLLVRAPRREPR